MRRAPLLVLAIALLVLPGCDARPPGGRVLVLGFDGLDPRAVDLLASVNLEDPRRVESPE